MNQIAGVAFALAVIAGIYLFGYSEGEADANAKATADALELRDQRDALQVKLDTSDVALLEAKKERDDARAKEVVKYVTVYREKIKEPAIAQCINDSGLLQIYNSAIGVSSPGK